MLNSWWVGNNFWRNFIKSTPEETPLETPLNRFIFGSKQSSRGTQRNNSIEPNDTARSFLILQNHSCQTLPTCSQGTYSAANAETSSNCEVVSILRQCSRQTRGDKITSLVIAWYPRELRCTTVSVTLLSKSILPAFFMTTSAASAHIRAPTKFGTQSIHFPVVPSGVIRAAGIWRWGTISIPIILSQLKFVSISFSLLTLHSTCSSPAILSKGCPFCAWWISRSASLDPNVSSLRFLVNGFTVVIVIWIWFWITDTGTCPIAFTTAIAELVTAIANHVYAPFTLFYEVLALWAFLPFLFFR